MFSLFAVIIITNIHTTIAIIIIIILIITILPIIIIIVLIVLKTGIIIIIINITATIVTIIITRVRVLQQSGSPWSPEKLDLPRPPGGSKSRSPNLGPYTTKGTF